MTLVRFVPRILPSETNRKFNDVFGCAQLGEEPFPLPRGYPVLPVSLAEEVTTLFQPWLMGSPPPFCKIQMYRGVEFIVPGGQCGVSTQIGRGEAPSGS